jgi:hypothetical protein
MNRLMCLLLLFVLCNCSFGSNNKKVFWCGDHPCINKKERQEYFKQNMIVEVKKINKKKIKNSELEKVMNQAKKNEVKRINNEKLSAKQLLQEEKLKIKEEKLRIKEEKKLAKKIRLDEKKRTQEAKKMQKNEKKEIKMNKKDSKKSTLINNNTLKVNKSSDSFDLLKNKIFLQNSSKKFPDLNQTYK